MCAPFFLNYGEHGRTPHNLFVIYIETVLHPFIYEVNYATRNTKRVYRDNSILCAIVIYGILGAVMATLEQEFEEYKALHKFAILKAKIMQYYKDIENEQINVPDFMRIGQRPEDKADKALKELVLRNDNLAEFNRLYELAYNDIAERLD